MSSAETHRPGGPPFPTPPAGIPAAQPAWPVPAPPPAPAPPVAVPVATVVPVRTATPALPPMPQAPLPLSAQPAPQPVVRPVVAKPVVPVAPQALTAQPALPPMPAAPAARPVPVSAMPVSAVPAGALPANRPLPVGPRPIPVENAKTVAGTPLVDADKSDEPPPDPTQKAARSAPPWLVSMVVHMVMIIVLALLTVPQLLDRQISIESVWAEKLGEQIIDDVLESPESLDMQVEVPELALDLNPVNDPLASPPILDILNVDATSAVDNIEAPSIGLALTGREAGMKKALLAAYGGNATTEAAVRTGLEWLKRQQMKDGGWSLSGPFPDGADTDNRCAATAMALLAFQGAGHTHQIGDFQKEVQRGWEYLLKTQNADGFFEHEGGHNHRLYAQAQATIAVVELYGMTKDEKFKKPAQLALDFAHKAQAPEGGWRYQPKVDSDTSVTGWYVMALQSGRMAGLEVQSPAEEAIHKYLDSCTKNGVHYSYQAGMEYTLPMTAEALLCRQYLGWKHDDERMLAGIEYLLANPIDYTDENVYYWYYATQACHHMDGDHWNRWNRVMRQEVPEHQVKTGNDRGSWPPTGDRWGPRAGRLYTTCLSVFMLEVYYRHLPIYKWRLD